MVGMMDTFHTWYIELSYGEKKPFVCGGGQRSFDVTRGQKLKPCTVNVIPQDITLLIISMWTGIQPVD